LQAKNRRDKPMTVFRQSKMNEYLSTTKLASLYVLIFPECGLLKVGKANNVYARCQQLKHYWGDPDYDESLVLVAPEKTVFRLEKALHLLLTKNYAADALEGDGHTEMFRMDALGLVLPTIDLFVKAGVVPTGLRKGIKLRGRRPIPAPPLWGTLYWHRRGSVALVGPTPK
jgi:hypothetical protein